MVAPPVRIVVGANVEIKEQFMFKTVYVLMEDDWGSTFSKLHKTGQIVETIEEADKWVSEGSYIGQRDYRERRVEYNE